MINEQRRATLEKNQDNIHAIILSTKNATEREHIWQSSIDSCMYTYTDGSHCAVGACLSDKELLEIEKRGVNDAATDEIADIVENPFSVEEFEMLTKFQDLHDMCCCHSSDDRQFWNFKKALNQILETGKLDVCISMENSRTSDNQYFELVDNEWVPKLGSLLYLRDVPALDNE